MKKNKVLVQNSITYAIVIACWILVQILGATGHMTSLLKGLLVPLCIYVILAVSLNLTVGILGELSLGHAGFMCVGAFTGAFFTKCMENAIPSVGMRFFLALIIGAAVAGCLLYTSPAATSVFSASSTRCRRACGKPSILRTMIPVFPSSRETM